MRGPDVLELGVAACASSIGTARTVASDVAMRADLDLDAIADVRMAVDEACSQLVAHSDPVEVMWVRFHQDTDCLRVHISARLRAGDPGIDESSFGWHVLRALTDELEVAGGLEADVVSIRMSKRMLGS